MYHGSMTRGGNDKVPAYTRVYGHGNCGRRVLCVRTCETGHEVEI